MKKLLTTLALTLGLFLSLPTPTASADDWVTPVDCEHPADCTPPQPPLCADAPDNPDCYTPEPEPCQVWVDHYAARVGALTTKVDALESAVATQTARANRAENLAERRAETIKELRAKIRALR